MRIQRFNDGHGFFWRARTANQPGMSVTTSHGSTDVDVSNGISYLGVSLTTAELREAADVFLRAADEREWAGRAPGAIAEYQKLVPGFQVAEVPAGRADAGTVTAWCGGDLYITEGRYAGILGPAGSFDYAPIGAKIIRRPDGTFTCEGTLAFEGEYRLR